MIHIYNFFGGRTTTAFWVLLTIGAVLAFIGKLTPHYVGLAATLHAFIVTRSISEDKYVHARLAEAGEINAITGTPATEGKES